MTDNTEQATARRPVAVSSTSSLDSSATAQQLYQQQQAGADISNLNQSGIATSALDDIPFSTAFNHPFMFSDDDTSPLLYPAAAQAQVPMMTESTSDAARVPNPNTVPEFLYQLTKMLTDDNRDVIEWVNGKIEVHSPHRLENEVLNRYFRHSKFASFQRQLNYFGFRKLAGKGKMAPCSYTNDGVTGDLNSLLLLKRNAGTNAPQAKNTTTKPAPSRSKRKRSPRKAAAAAGTVPTSAGGTVDPVLKGILDRSRGSSSTAAKEPATSAKIAVGKGVKHQLNGYLKGTHLSSSSDHKALARAAAGKGVRHGYLSQPSNDGVAAAMESNNEPGSQSDIQSSLSELTSNYRLATGANGQLDDGNLDDSAENILFGPGGLGFLSRDSSLVNLAMLPMGNDDEEALVEPTPVSELGHSVMPFVDFPQRDTGQSMDK